MADDLAGGEHGGNELGAVDDRVEAALQQPDQLLRGRPLEARGFLVDAIELALADIAIIALQLLLGAELLAVVAEFAGAAFAMLAGARLALVERAL